LATINSMDVNCMKHEVIIKRGAAIGKDEK
jgi:hypothetical protein